ARELALAEIEAVARAPLGYMPTAQTGEYGGRGYGDGEGGEDERYTEEANAPRDPHGADTSPDQALADMAVSNEGRTAIAQAFDKLVTERPKDWAPVLAWASWLGHSGHPDEQ